MNKKILMFVLPILAIGLVVAGAVYYNMFSVTLDVNQPITVTGDLSQVVNCDAGDTCLGTEPITVTNTGDEEEVVIVTDNSGDNIDVSYVGILELTKKDSNWVAIPDEQIELTYTVVGEEFEFSGVPVDHTLIYYMDEFAELGDRVANPQPAIIVVSDIGSLPQIEDANSELANYCQDPDNYAHCNGAKLWVVPNGDLAGNTLSWTNMFNGYYYETDLVYYFANANGEIIVPENSFIEFYPQFAISQHASDGPRTIEITVA